MKILFPVKSACLLFILSFTIYEGNTQVKQSPIVIGDSFSNLISISATSVKNQGNTGTCWSFSGTSLIESQFLRNNSSSIDLSEIFTARNIYKEKAMNYLLRQGKAQFSEGALGHDLIRSIATYGAVPESAYSGLYHKTYHDHSKLVKELKGFLDSILDDNNRPISATWYYRFDDILDRHLGKVPANFEFEGKQYTPVSFARDVLAFKESDYFFLTSFSHHPYYSSFILEVPDNFSNGSYFNVPISVLMNAAEGALRKGYSVLWDADVSNTGFRQQTGFALLPVEKANPGFDPDGLEKKVEADTRQALFEGLATQDDHLMHMTGLEKSKTGKLFFKVKNSWGQMGPYEGYIKVSEAYFLENTISLVIPKAAIDQELLLKMGIK